MLYLRLVTDMNSPESFWQDLEQKTSQETSAEGTLWARLKEATDFSLSRPQQAPNTVIVPMLSEREGRYYIIKNPDYSTYLKLSPQDYYLWTLMDGEHSVKDLVVAYFSKFRAFAFGRVAAFVNNLKARHFLTEQPSKIYEQIEEKLAQRGWRYWGMHAIRSFRQQEFSIRGLDRIAELAYKYGCWIFFTKVSIGFCFILSIIGLGLFIKTFLEGDYYLLNLGGAYGWSVLGLIFANFLVIFIHESAHALTVKHFKREVRRGGFMFYYGIPTFFVDTMDMWLEGRLPRIFVSAAGPNTGIIIGGVASIVLHLFPQLPINPFLFQFAAMTYLNVFLNLNPLLELDGYFMLMDWLEIPMLRQRAMDFVLNKLWHKLRKKEPFSPEERIFTIFGILAMVWTVLAIIFALAIWQQRFISAIADILSRSGLVNKILPSLLLLLFGVPLVLGILSLIDRTVQGTAQWIKKQRVFEEPTNIFFALLILTVVLTLHPLLFEQNYQYWYQMIIPPIALGLSLYVAARSLFHLRETRLFYPVLFGTLFLLGITTVYTLHLLMPLLPLTVPEFWINSLERVSFICAILAAGSLYVNVRMFKSLRVERAGYVLGMATSLFLAFGVFWLKGGQLTVENVIVSIIPAIVFQVALFTIPTFMLYNRTGFDLGLAMMSWATNGLALNMPLRHEIYIFSDYILHIGASILMMMGTALLLILGRRDMLGPARPTDEVSLTDRERLRAAFDYLCWSAILQLEARDGQQLSEMISEQFNITALRAGWPIAIVKGKVKNDVEHNLSIMDQSEIYQAALAELLRLFAENTTGRMTTQILTRGYDRLNWEEKEVANRYLLGEIIWAEPLLEDFQTMKRDYHSLVNRIPVLSGLEEAETDLICSRFGEEQYAPGDTIIRQGDEGEKFHIIKRGRVEAWIRDERGQKELVNRLSYNDYFGETALLTNEAHKESYVAVTPTETLSLSKRDFDRLLKWHFQLSEKAGIVIAHASLLRRMPLFAPLSPADIGYISERLVEKSVPAGRKVFEQGKEGDEFYIIKVGQVDILFIKDDGTEQLLSSMGQGEYFGEISLLKGRKRTATARAAMETQLLVLDKEDFSHLITQYEQVKRDLEQVSSRRLIHWRQVAKNPTFNPN